MPIFSEYYVSINKWVTKVQLLASMLIFYQSTVVNIVQECVNISLPIRGITVDLVMWFLQVQKSQKFLPQKYLMQAKVIDKILKPKMYIS